MVLNTLSERINSIRKSNTTTDSAPQRDPISPIVTPLMILCAYTRIHNKTELKGNVRLTKLTFLFEQERLNNPNYDTPDIPTYNYYSHDYGPASNHLIQDLHSLDSLEIRSTETDDGNTIHHYKPTPQLHKDLGKHFGKASLALHEYQSTIDDFIQSHGNMPITRLHEYTLERHEYNENASIKF